MNKKDNSVYLFFVMIVVVIIAGYLQREWEEKYAEKEPKQKYFILEEKMHDDEVERFGGWEAYEKMQRQMNCWDICEGWDDPICEECGKIE